MAHALRSGVSNLGAHEVARRCADLESTAPDIEPAAMAEAVRGIDLHLAEAREALLRRFSRPAARTADTSRSGVIALRDQSPPLR